MKIGVCICIVCLVLIGTASAAGGVIPVKVVRNTSAVQIAVPTTQPTQDQGIIANIVAPIAHVLPAVTETPAVQATVQEGDLNTTLLSQVSSAAPNLSGLTQEQKYEKLQLEHSPIAPGTDLCTDYNSLHVLSGKIKHIVVEDSPGQFWNGLLLDQDGKNDVLVSDNDHIFTMMQTAFIANHEVLLAGYLSSGNPNDTMSYVYPTYHVCWIEMGSL